MSRSGILREAPTRRRNILGLAGNSQISTGRRENTTLYFLNPSSASVKQRGSAERYLPASAASLHRPSSSSSSRQGRARRHRSCAQLRPRPITASIAANGTTASQRLSLPSLFFFLPKTCPNTVPLSFRLSPGRETWRGAHANPLPCGGSNSWKRMGRSCVGDARGDEQTLRRSSSPFAETKREPISAKRPENFLCDSGVRLPAYGLFS